VLEPDTTSLRRAAAIGDVSYIQGQIELAESASSPAAITAASAQFRQRDTNGWQPIHEAARSGHFDVLKLLLEADNVGVRTWRRRAGKLQIDVNARTNNDRGVTALRLVEEHHGPDDECAQLLRAVGGVSLGFEDGVENE
jgi:ankyrin repeat protein